MKFFILILAGIGLLTSCVEPKAIETDSDQGILSDSIKGGRRGCKKVSAPSILAKVPSLNDTNNLSLQADEAKSLNFTLKNNNNTACAAANYNLALTDLPSGVSHSSFPGSIQLVSGASLSVTIQLSANSAIVTGSHDIRFTMTNIDSSSNFASADIALHLTALVSSPEPAAPLLLSATHANGNYTLIFEQPSGSMLPAGGYDTYFNGVDQNDRSAYSGFTRVISGLDNQIEQCFKLEARYTQVPDMPTYPISNQICVAAVVTTPNCIKANPTLTVTPASFTGVVGSNFNYNVSLTNNNQYCDNQSYNLSYQDLPAQFNSNLPASRILASGEQANFAVVMNSESSMNSAVYTPILRAVDASSSSYSASRALTFNLTDENNTPQELKAFPDAHGYGRYATGGRGGRIIEVTNLNDSGTGSLREALTSSGKRTIIFKVAGNINLASRLKITNGEFTIAGETAPGQGIAITGIGGVQVEEGNFIIRHIRFRGSSVISNLRLIPDDGKDVDKGIIDHCSFSWPDVAEMNISMSGGRVKNITIQNNILGESTRGILLYKGPHRVSVFRNLLANIQQRAVLSNYPSYSPADELGFEEINNILHNIQVAPIQASYGTKFTAIGNRRTNSSTSYVSMSAFINLYSGGEGDHSLSYVYQRDNDNALGGDLFGSGTVQYVQNSPYDSSDIVDDLILPVSNIGSILSSIGAFPGERDSVDSRYVADYVNNTGAIGTYTGTPPTLRTGVAYTDVDQDGIADDWESNINGTIGDADHNGDHDGDGYTNLEEFLHYLADQR